MYVLGWAVKQLLTTTMRRGGGVIYLWARFLLNVGTYYDVWTVLDTVRKDTALDLFSNL